MIAVSTQNVAQESNMQIFKFSNQFDTNQER